VRSFRTGRRKISDSNNDVVSRTGWRHTREASLRRPGRRTLTTTWLLVSDFGRARQIESLQQIATLLAKVGELKMQALQSIREDVSGILVSHLRDLFFALTRNLGIFISCQSTVVAPREVQSHKCIDQSSHRDHGQSYCMTSNKARRFGGLVELRWCLSTGLDKWLENSRREP
jgi:hypothetical protein